MSNDEPNRWEEKTRHVHEEDLVWLDESGLQTRLEALGLDPNPAED